MEAWTAPRVPNTRRDAHLMSEHFSEGTVSLSCRFSDKVSPPTQGHLPFLVEDWGRVLLAVTGRGLGTPLDTPPCPRTLSKNTLSCPRNNYLSPNIKQHVLKEAQPQQVTLLVQGETGGSGAWVAQ